MTLNGGVPGPVLRFREGDTVAVNLRNDLPEMKAIHWHGLLIPGHHEGDTDGSGRMFGWATGAPYGARMLSMRDLVAAQPGRDARADTGAMAVSITVIRLNLWVARALAIVAIWLDAKRPASQPQLAA